MITLILDTNIWFYLAKGEHPFVLQKLLEKYANREVEFLVSSIQIDEWTRNKPNIIDDIKKAIHFQGQNAQTIAEYLDGEQKETFIIALSAFRAKEQDILSAAESRFALIEDILTNKSAIAQVQDFEKIEVADWAIQKKAPFHRNKNSYADALILLSTINYIKENSIHKGDNGLIEVPDSIFVSFNSDDFSKGTQGNEKNLLHPDLEPLLGSIHMTFERNIGKLLNLTDELKVEIDRYWEYIDALIQSHLESEIEIMCGK